MFVNVGVCVCMAGGVGMVEIFFLGKGIYFYVVGFFFWFWCYLDFGGVNIEEILFL